MANEGFMGTAGGAPASGGGDKSGAGAPPPPASSVSFPENWKEGLPEEFRADPSLASIKDIPNLTKAFINAQKLIGKDKIPVPDQHATEEDWQNIFDKLGRPKELKDYQVKLDKEAGLEDSFLDSFKEQAHKAGILPKQAEKLLNWYGLTAKGAAESLKAKHTEKQTAEIAELKKEWGNGFEQQIKIAELAIRDFGGDELIKHLKESGLNNDSRLIKVFAKIGAELREDKLPGGTSREGGGMTPEQAKERIESIKSDRQHPYYLKDHPNHQAAVAEMSKLWEQRYPAEQK